MKESSHKMKKQIMSLGHGDRVEIFWGRYANRTCFIIKANRDCHQMWIDGVGVGWVMRNNYRRVNSLIGKLVRCFVVGNVDDGNDDDFRLKNDDMVTAVFREMLSEDILLPFTSTAQVEFSRHLRNLKTKHRLRHVVAKNK